MPEAVISLKNIKREFRLGDEVIHALKGINIDINKNEYVALMGPSGSGKSTLMNILGCLDTPSEGHYFLQGKDVSQSSDNELAIIRNKQIGFIFQTFNLIPRLDTLENVALPLIYAGWDKQARQERAMEVLEQVGLENRMKHKPNELSGGQRQRVAVARALVNRPSLILADEPTGNLDSKMAKEVLSLLRELAQEEKQTIVMVTHDVEAAKYGTRLLIMRDGKVESDTR